MSFDIAQIPSWFMALAVVALCAYTAYSLKKRDEVLDNIVKAVYGTEDKNGMLTRISVMENTISRCESCSPAHHDGGRRPYDPEERVIKG